MQQIGAARDHGWQAHPAHLSRPAAPIATPRFLSPRRRKPVGTPRPERRRSLGILAALAIVCAGLSGAVGYTLISGDRPAPAADLPGVRDLDRLAASAGLGLDEVSLTGHRFTSDLDVFDALDLANARSFLAFDTAAARARIERLPWVLTAEITHIYPSRLAVRITERTPFAVWRRGNRHVLIDATGRELSVARPEDYAGLAHFAGEGAAAEAAALAALVDRHPALKARLVEAERVSGRRWTLRLKDNVVVHLPADREATALEALARSEALQALVSGPDRVVDLRARDRATTRPKAPQKAPAPDKLAEGGS